MKGVYVHDVQREGKLPGLWAAQVQVLQTLQVHPGLHGFMVNSSVNSGVHFGFLLDEMDTCTKMLVGTGFPYHVVMRENTQPFQ